MVSTCNVLKYCTDCPDQLLTFWNTYLQWIPLIAIQLNKPWHIHMWLSSVILQMKYVSLFFNADIVTDLMLCIASK